MCDMYDMSEYGRLWQEVWDIRARIRAALPGANTDTLEKATASIEAAGKTRELRHMLAAWASYERKMAQTDD
jgi:hypothetical protein